MKTFYKTKTFFKTFFQDVFSRRRRFSRRLIDLQDVWFFLKTFDFSQDVWFFSRRLIDLQDVWLIFKTFDFSQDVFFWPSRHFLIFKMYDWSSRRFFDLQDIFWHSIHFFDLQDVFLTFKTFFDLQDVWFFLKMFELPWRCLMHVKNLHFWNEPCIYEHLAQICIF